MYYFEGMPNTCSMVELCGLSEQELKTLTLGRLVDDLRDFVEESARSQCKVIIYNTNFEEGNRSLLEQIGFKEVFNYAGNEDHVYTMMLLV